MANYYTEEIDRAVREQDFAYLAGLIRHSPHMSPEERDHLATIILGLLNGTIKRPAHRPKKERTESHARLIAKAVVRLRRYKPEWAKLSAAVKKVAEDHGRAESTVWSALKKHRGAAIMHFEDFDYWYMVDAAHDAARQDAVEHLKEEHGDREFTDEEVNDEMEEQESRDRSLYQDFEDYDRDP